MDMNDLQRDLDPEETREWMEALQSVLEREGPDRANFLLEQLVNEARRAGAYIPYNANTAYLNTIPPEREERSSGDAVLEEKIRALVRWNAMATVIRANKESSELGGHIASFASAATLYDIGFNHFFRAANEKFLGDLVYIQGHSAPGVYARAYLEGRISEDQLSNFRQEVDGKGLSSYPHPWLMPDFWQFPTVSMGLGPLMAIYQARFMRYLKDRGQIEGQGRKVWAFMGDGEMDEPESLGAISLAGREKLDNLVFVINCNLQRLDGPVRGNGKIIQELESDFRGSGWNVIKVIWGSYWDPLLQKDKSGILLKRMEECVDGEYQTFKSQDGAFVRKHFFGKYPELADLVSNMSDDDIWRLNRGGHDPHKVFAAYAAAMKHTGQPTVILAKTVKGYGMGEAGEGQNITHQQKKMGTASIRAFRDRFSVPIPDDQLEDVPFYKPAEDSPEMKYLRERIAAMGGSLPSRKRKVEPLEVPALSAFEAQRRPRILDDDGLRAHSQHHHPRQKNRQTCRAHRARRIAHLRHGRHVPPARHLFPCRSAVYAAGRRPADVLQGRQGRPDSAGRHQRSGCDVVVDCCGDVVCEQRADDDPVLHFLFDVRFPAHRRSRLGSG
jgi:pyruvate dehydrogenase E1 component